MRRPRTTASVPGPGRPASGPAWGLPDRRGDLTRCAGTVRRTGAAVVVVALLAGCSAAASDAAPGGSVVTARPTVRTPPVGTPSDPSGLPSPAATGATPVIAPSGPFAVDELILTDGGRRIPVPVLVADSTDLRSRGLMGRTSLEPGTGMVFVYGEDHTGSYWMRDTLIPLSIAFAAADGVIHTIREMEPCTSAPCPRYSAGAPYRTALEVPQGWFAEQGVTTGWRLEGVPLR